MLTSKYVVNVRQILAASRTSLGPGTSTQPEAPELLAAPMDAASLLELCWREIHGDVARLQGLCDVALARAHASSDPLSAARALLTRALLMVSYRPLEATEADLESAGSAPVLQQDQSFQRMLTIGRAQLRWNQGDVAGAQTLFKVAEGDAVERPREPADFLLLSGLAGCAVVLSQIEDAFFYFYRAVVFAECIDRPACIAYATAGLASTFQSVGWHDETVALLEKLLDDGHLPAANKKLVTLVNNNLVMAQVRSGKIEPDRAISELVALTPDVERHAPHWLVTLHMNLSSLYLEEGRLDAAAEMIGLAYEASYSGGRTCYVGVCHIHAGMLLHERGNLHEALLAFHLAKECHAIDPNGFAWSLWSVDRSIAKTHAALGHFEAAYAAQCDFDEALRNHTECGVRGRRAAASARQRVGALMGLTPREIECLRWSASGKTAWETSRILGLSEWTVVYHLERAKRKFGLSSKQQMVARAVGLGLVAGPEPEAAYRP